jgi:hypothetical protein
LEEETKSGARSQKSRTLLANRMATIGLWNPKKDMVTWQEEFVENTGLKSLKKRS